MLFYQSGITDSYRNLALEEYIFRNAPENEKVFMIWQNDNTIVIGKNQNTIQEINQDFVRKMKTKVSRRITGGGAVYHDLGNLNFTFIERHQGTQNIDFSAYTKPIVRALDKIGVAVKLQGRNDLLIDGKKISGNAQTIQNGVLLHHGTLLFDSNLEFIKEALVVKEDKIRSKGIPSVRSRVTNIKEYLAEEITLEDFKEKLVEEILCSHDTKSMILTEEDQSLIQKLRNEKYATWEWNYGSSPQYEVEKYRKFSFGSVTLSMDVKEGGIIRDVKIRGDFFGNADISELEMKLIGLKRNKAEIEANIKGWRLQDYIAGMEAEEFVELVCF